MTSNSETFFGDSYLTLQTRFEALAERRFKQKESQLIDELSKNSPDTSYQTLMESLKYSFFSGGKRFRPVIGFAMGRLCGLKDEETFPWVFAIEMIHTYSLIHDDLPCMDDDDERRGRPTNHIQYGEAMALLAGDALLTDAFGELSGIANVAALPKLLSMLSKQAGLHGMITGQVMDIQFESAWSQATNSQEKFQVLQQIHHLKTAKLIQLSCAGPAVICGGTQKMASLAESFGASLGYAFQIADDILDSQDEEQQNMVSLIGLEKTRDLLQDISLDCRKHLQELAQIFDRTKENDDVRFLDEMIVFNQNRKK